MNEAIKAKWVAALRSGDYKQGRRQLRTGNKFCCLGVLCNLHAQAHPAIAASQISKHNYLNKTDFLPPKVMEWAGLKTNNGALSFGTFLINSLSELNDAGESFKTIAAVIEENF